MNKALGICDEIAIQNIQMLVMTQLKMSMYSFIRDWQDLAVRIDLVLYDSNRRKLLTLKGCGFMFSEDVVNEHRRGLCDLRQSNDLQDPTSKFKSTF